MSLEFVIEWEFFWQKVRGNKQGKETTRKRQSNIFSHSLRFFYLWKSLEKAFITIIMRSKRRDEKKWQNERRKKELIEDTVCDRSIPISIQVSFHNVWLGRNIDVMENGWDSNDYNNIGFSVQGYFDWHISKGLTFSSWRLTLVIEESDEIDMVKRDEKILLSKWIDMRGSLSALPTNFHHQLFLPLPFSDTYVNVNCLR